MKILHTKLILIFFLFIIATVFLFHKIDISFGAAQIEIPKHEITLVSGYFDISRNGRSPDWYLSYLNRTLQIPLPFVVFTEERFVERVRSFKDQANLTVIAIEKPELPYYKYLNQSRSIIQNPEYQLRMKCEDYRLECFDPMYTIVVYSKFFLVRLATHFNLYKTKKFVWVDAGLSRFFHSWNPLDGKWHGSHISNRLIAKSFSRISDHFDIDEYPWGHNNVIAATLMGGNRELFERMTILIEKVYVDWLAKGVVTNEQHAMYAVYHEYPELFDLQLHSSAIDWSFDDILPYIQA